MDKIFSEKKLFIRSMFCADGGNGAHAHRPSRSGSAQNEAEFLSCFLMQFHQIYFLNGVTLYRVIYGAIVGMKDTYCKKISTFLFDFHSYQKDRVFEECRFTDLPFHKNKGDD